MVTTESGFRFRIEQSDDNYDRDPKNKDEVRFMVEFDNSTMQNGLDQAPDRLDLWFSPPQHGVGFSPGLSVPLVVRHEQSAIWTLPKDQVKPVIDMQITVARRYADHKLPFSLILPLKHEDSAPSIQTSPNAP